MTQPDSTQPHSSGPQSGRNAASQVTRRRVFYIPGYDPIHPRRYRELYRSEGAAQAAISGYDLALKPRAGHNYGWQVDAKMDGISTQSEVEVLVWSDIVRGSMASSIPATYAQLIRTAWTYISSGALRRLMWLRKGPVIAALYPVGMLILQLVLALWLGSVVYRGLGWAGASAGLNTVGLAALMAVVQGAAFVGVAVAVLRWFKRRDGKFFAYYLMHDYAYSAHWKGANPPDLEARMTQFKDTISEALRDEVDEVLVVGHSSGAHLGVSILADLIRDGQASQQGPMSGSASEPTSRSKPAPKLGFLSLGQVVPMVSFLPHADRLRADLHYLSTRSELTWIDVTAPGDGCAFALCDPVAVSGVAPEGQKWPLVISAAFTQTLSPARWKELRWRFFRLHFQYLCAFDRVGDYDYFRITAGPVTLAQRYAERAPSKSRITIAASKFTSRTP